jgi:type IV pilus assembly protein PilZ
MSKKAHTKNNAKDGAKSFKTQNATANHESPSAADRADHRVPIQLLVDYKAEGHYLFDFCRDLGTGGVFIETQQPLGAGAELDLTFTIPDSKETLRTKAKVVWSQSPIAGRNDINPGMGVQFTQFNDAQRKKLDDFVSRFANQKSGSPLNRRAG